jgi:diaminohydroxyphosphoribosylaminopyrimidine deaminase/5-amino-6-(5-phosphoribosylamino)uracil reductase
MIRETADSTQFDAWTLAQAGAKAIGAFDATRSARFALDPSGRLCPLSPDDARAVLAWNPVRGWESSPADDDARRDLLDLYLPISSATPDRPITIGHLGQSLDGFIATKSGDSRFITGPENILHLHRLRALCDAVVVGAGTVAADNPRLTTRLVAGSNPVRVVLDPACRLVAAHTVFCDSEALTLRACAAGAAMVAEARERGEQVLEIAARANVFDLRDLLRQLRARGYFRIFVEGGGVTVSSFLEAGLLDRLHIAVAPLLIGDGHPAVRMASRVRLQDCMRLQHRVFRAGDDILFDCDLRAKPCVPSNGQTASSPTTIQRIL